MKKILLLVFLVNFVFSQTLLEESFDALGSPITLPAGWAMTNQSQNASASAWFTGNPSSFAAHSGPTNGYIAANFQSIASGVGTISTWLISPTINVQNGDEVSFYSRAGGQNWPDRLELRMSTLGDASTTPSTGPTDLGSYTNLALTINPDLTNTGYPQVWTKYTYVVSGLSGPTNCKFAFRYFVTQGGPSGSNSNYIGVDEFLAKRPQPNSASLTSTNIDRYELINVGTDVLFAGSNTGNNTITSLKLNWNDGVDHEHLLTGLNILPGEDFEFTHPTSLVYATAQEKNIMLSVSEVNALPNGETNNSLERAYNSISQNSPKKVVIEKGTGTWCGWCVRGIVAFNNIEQMFPNEFIGINMHNGDPMTLAEYNSASAFTGYPQMHVDRLFKRASVTQQNMETAINLLKDLKVPASLSASGNVSGNQISIDVHATFRTVFANANYKVAVIVKEDGVTGTTAQYNQANFYAGGGQGPMGGFESLPNPVPAAQMVYNKVGRALLGGYNGTSISSSIVDGGVYSQNYSYTIPTGANPNNFKGVAMLIDGDFDNYIVNAIEFDLATLSVEENVLTKVSIYPNPTNDFFRINVEETVSVDVVDITGKTVAQFRNVDNNANINVSQLNSGVYFVNIRGNKTFEPVKLIKK